jgi:hypothetical protein
MIRHIVLFRARPGVTEAEIAAILADLGAIRDRLPGILAYHGGRSESPEQIERGYMHGFTMDFADWEALQAYQVHPDHRRAAAALVAASDGGGEGILVFDLPC